MICRTCTRAHHPPGIRLSVRVLIGPISPTQHRHSPFRMRASEFFDLSRFKSSYTRLPMQLHPGPRRPSTNSASFIPFYIPRFFIFPLVFFSAHRAQSASNRDPHDASPARVAYICIGVIQHNGDNFIHSFDEFDTDRGWLNIGRGRATIHHATRATRHACASVCLRRELSDLKAKRDSTGFEDLLSERDRNMGYGNEIHGMIRERGIAICRRLRLF